MDGLLAEMSRKKCTLQSNTTTPSTKLKKVYVKNKDIRARENNALDAKDGLILKRDKPDVASSVDAEVSKKKVKEDKVETRIEITDVLYDQTGSVPNANNSSSTGFGFSNKIPLPSDLPPNTDPLISQILTSTIYKTQTQPILSISAQQANKKKLTKNLRTYSLPIKFYNETFERGLLRYLYVLEIMRSKGVEGLDVEVKRQNFVMDGSGYKGGEGRKVGLNNVFLKQRDGDGEVGDDDGSDDDDDDDKNANKKEKKAKNPLYLNLLSPLQPPISNPPPGDDNKEKYVYHFLKQCLKKWSQDLNDREKGDKVTAKGKNDLLTFKQCKDYIHPLLKKLKTKNLDAAQLVCCFKIVNYCRLGEFVEATNTYIDISIGRAPWPIGVTQVGIHSRASHEKISDNKVAHVMGDEGARKYLQSVKRIVGWYSRGREDVGPSKKVE